MAEAARIDLLLAQARRGLDRVDPADLESEMAAGAVVVDTRPIEQRRRDGELPGALTIDRNVLEWRLDPSCTHHIPEVADPDVRIVVVCNEGFSSSLAAATLRDLGLKRATDLIGGFQAWRELSDSAKHWDAVYRQGHAGRSWYQDRPDVSLGMLQNAALTARDSILDIGGGASTLVDFLVEKGWSDLTVLDISAIGLRTAQTRLGTAAERVNWICADLLSWRPERSYSVWHDRALLHFFTAEQDRARYRDALQQATAVGSVAIFGVFSPDGPPNCSGLPVARYGVPDLADFVGASWELLTAQREAHRTPAGSIQQFTWTAFRRIE
jgi:rhodanese-related sulfurtransferase